MKKYFLALIAFTSTAAHAFWLLNFQTAPALPPGGIAFIGGTGGQVTSVGSPSQDSFTPFLAHAGIRVGLFDHFDVGYRLCTVPLPYSSVGPSLGGELDAKYQLTRSSSRWQIAVIGGVAASYLSLSGKDKTAWSPGAEITVSHSISDSAEIALNGRYVYTAIPSASGGASQNYVHAFGESTGLKLKLSQAISVMPELGVFRLLGSISGGSADGIGVQYGAVLGAKLN